MLSRISVALVGAGLVVACASGYKFSHYEVPTNNYPLKTVMSFQYSGDATGRCKLEVKLKVYNQSNQLAVCGYLVSPEETGCLYRGAMSDQLIEAWFNASTLHFDGEPIAKGAFIVFPDRKNQVQCVITEKRWVAGYRTATPRLVGGDVAVSQ